MNIEWLQALPFATQSQTSFHLPYIVQLEEGETVKQAENAIAFGMRHNMLRQTEVGWLVLPFGLPMAAFVPDERP